MQAIMFNTEMVKAIIRGDKIQTRRAVSTLLTPNNIDGFNNVPMTNLNPKTHKFELYTTPHTEKSKDGLFGGVISAYDNGGLSKRTEQYIKPQYKVGQVLWLREPARVVDFDINTITGEYMADGKRKTIAAPERFLLKVGQQKKPSDTQIYTNWIWNKQGMPNGCIKEMARIFIEITNVRVEKLFDISYADLLREGMQCDFEQPKHDRENELYANFQNVWDSCTKGDARFKRNPYVLVYDFKIVGV